MKTLVVRRYDDFRDRMDNYEYGLHTFLYNVNDTKFVGFSTFKEVAEIVSDLHQRIKSYNKHSINVLDSENIILTLSYKMLEDKDILVTIREYVDFVCNEDSTTGVPCW